MITNPGLVGGGVEGWDGSGQNSSDLKEQQAGHKSLFCILTLKPRLYTPFCKEILDLLQGSSIHSSLSDIQKCESKQFVPFCPKIAYLGVHESPKHKNEEPLKKKL